MSISDPANLLSRIPELEQLAEDPKIRKAIEHGDPFKVYRALLWAKWFRRLPAHQTTLNELVRQRRLFAKPLKGTPALGTINSVGFSFVGSSEQEADGTHIALHAFVFLYIIPLIPFGSYLVQKTESGVFSSQWRIYARVPAGLLGWLYSRGMGAALVISVIWGAASSYHSVKTQDIMVLNGFEVPLDVDLDGKKALIPAQGRTVINVSAGDVSGTASAKKQSRLIPVDTFRNNVSSQGGYTIWNIAGAAPLLREEVKYTKTPITTPPEANPADTLYCGQRYIEVSGVDYAFQEPPKSVSMSKYDTSVTRVHLDVVSVPKQSGINICTYYAYSRDKAELAAGFLEVVAELGDWEPGMTGNAIFTASKKSTKEAIRVAQKALAARPDDIELHRLYQHVRDDAGQSLELEREYRERASRQPDSAAAQYLRAILMHGPEGLAEFERLASVFSKDPYILRSLTWRRMTHGDYSHASQGWVTLKALSPKDAERVLDAQIFSLLAQNRARDAFDLLTAFLQDPKNENRVDRAVQLALVARLTQNDPHRVLTKLFEGKNDPVSLEFARVRAGLEPAPMPGQPASLIKLSIALRDKPANAIQLAMEMSHAEYSALGADQWALLYGEAVRSGNQPLAARLEKFIMHASYFDREVFKKYIRGETVDLTQADLEPSIRAAAHFIRSRNTTLSGTERKELRDRAMQSDLLHGVVTAAISRWPT